MSEKPVRIQLSRKKGWRMPENTVKVSRPGPFGNPYSVDGAIDAGYKGTREELGRLCAESFAEWLRGDHWTVAQPKRDVLLQRLPELRGKNLACWCRQDHPCHADVLLDLANRPVCTDPTQS